MAGTARAGGMRVRRARSSDIPQLALLAGQLGYPSSEDEIRVRLAGIEAAPEHALIVAESADGKLAGFLNVYVMRTIDSDARTEIAALVVDDAHRSLGVGKVLIEQAEAWARENGCRAIGLRSNVIRERAHRFYERLGYEHYKTQKTFRKIL
ncbi:MAG TPA: GNAT family N-acetyltransferase [Candidatus Acidoferrales bacterium]|nr:GNAT family N-acetyltransferase [Candidatus Acidoferrales bacterium]